MIMAVSIMTPLYLVRVKVEINISLMGTPYGQALHVAPNDKMIMRM
jgi:hypothetical protein